MDKATNRKGHKLITKQVATKTFLFALFFATLSCQSLLLKHSSTIFRRLAAVVLLGIFTCAITPVTVFHDLVSNHVDTNIQHHHTHQSELANASFNCHADGFVADVNYSSSAPAFQHGAAGYHLRFCK